MMKKTYGVPTLAEIKQYEAEKKKKSRRKKKSPANALTDAIMKYVKLKGGYAARINTTGIWDNERKLFRTTGATRGFPDVAAIKDGVFVGIEVKAGRDTMRDAQKKQKQLIEQAGGVYIIARELDQFIKEFEKV